MWKIILVANSSVVRAGTKLTSSCSNVGSIVEISGSDQRSPSEYREIVKFHASSQETTVSQKQKNNEKTIPYRLDIKAALETICRKQM